MGEDRTWEIFLKIHADNPREGPGSSACTKRAFGLLPPLPARPRILDIGCGPGMQTLDLCRLTNAAITAVDKHVPYLDALCASARQAGFRDRIQIVPGDMAELKFPTQTFDLIWAEACIYIIGFEKGLHLWRPLLKNGGCLVVSEAVWLKDGAPKELRDFWAEGYPAMQDNEANLEAIRQAGYEPLGHFLLPESTWWDYYKPIIARLPSIKEKYQNVPEAADVIAAEELEMEFYRKYSEYYGYFFYVMRLA